MAGINIFPQNGVPRGELENLNGSAYNVMTNELDDWIKAGAEVRLEVRLGKMDANGRPGVVGVDYEVYRPGSSKEIHSRHERFDNEPGQKFDRMTKQEILATMAKNP